MHAATTLNCACVVAVYFLDATKVRVVYNKSIIWCLRRQYGWILYSCAAFSLACGSWKYSQPYYLLTHQIIYTYVSAQKWKLMYSLNLGPSPSIFSWCLSFNKRSKGKACEPKYTTAGSLIYTYVPGQTRKIPPVQNQCPLLDCTGQWFHPPLVTLLLGLKRGKQKVQVYIMYVAQ